MVTIKASGVMRVRVPLGHWILGDIASDETYINGEWPFFLRMLEWAQEEKLVVWLTYILPPAHRMALTIRVTRVSLD